MVRRERLVLVGLAHVLVECGEEQVQQVLTGGVLVIDVGNDVRLDVFEDFLEVFVGQVLDVLGLKDFPVQQAELVRLVHLGFRIVGFREIAFQQTGQYVGDVSQHNTGLSQRLAVLA